MKNLKRLAPPLPAGDDGTLPPLDVFVASSPAERASTAALLVETAQAHGISQRHILSSNRGFYISDELADIVYDVPDEDDTSETPDPADAGDGTTK